MDGAGEFYQFEQSAAKKLDMGGGITPNFPVQASASSVKCQIFTEGNPIYRISDHGNFEMDPKSYILFREKIMVL